jgi:hypothetical protein
MTPRRLLPAALAVALLASASAEAKLYDFNNDRRQDLVVGLPSWHTKDGKEVGALVAFGSKRNLLGRARVLTRESLGVPPGRQAQIGKSVASADFDGDDYEDLVLGMPHFDADGGALVNYGSRAGLSGRRTELEDRGGESLVAGDMNGEGIDDLAVGAGDLELHFGTAGGLAPSPDVTLDPPADRGERFGEYLAHGDVTDDGHAELIEAGPDHISLALGSRRGPQQPEMVASGLSGWLVSLAIGDVDGDGYGDLAAGLRNNGRGGAVKVWSGGPDGLDGGPLRIKQGRRGVPGSNERGDRFGASVAVGRIDRDRYADLVVGAPREDSFRGSVTIIRGGPNGYARRGHRRFDLATPGIPGSKDRERSFGQVVSLLDFNGDDRLDLAVLDLAGVTVLRGTRRGISPKGAIRLTFASEDLDPFAGGSRPRLGRAGSSS